MAEGDVWAIDVSRWQGVIDWHAVKNCGVQGAWIKVGGADGGLYPDSKGQANMAGAESVGMPYGTYYFAHPAVGDAIRQAEHAVSVGHGRGALWPTLDLETNPYGMSAQQLDEFTTQFCDHVMHLTGRETLLYTGAYTGVGHCAPGVPSCPLWIASYGKNQPGTEPPGFTPKVPVAWDTYDAWQFNSVTYVDGIPSNTVDQNTVRAEFWELMLGGGESAITDEDEDDMALTGIVRTKIGSAWAQEHFGNNSIAHYILTIEGARRVRPLTPESLQVELFWKGMTIDQVWEVDDNFFTGGRYMLEPNTDTLKITLREHDGDLVEIEVTDSD